MKCWILFCRLLRLQHGRHEKAFKKKYFMLFALLVPLLVYPAVLRDYSFKSLVEKKNSTQSCQSSSIDNVRVLYAHCWFYSCSSDISNWWLFCLFSDFLNNFKNQVGRETFSLLTHFVDIFCRSKSSMHMFITKIYHVKVILWINKVINKLQVG